MLRCGIVVGYLSFLLHVTINGLSIPLDKDATAENIRVTFQSDKEDRVRRHTNGVTEVRTVLPETTLAQFTLNGQSVDIHLERNNNFNDIPLFMSRNGHVEQVFVAKEQTTAVYQSKEHGGSFLIMLDYGINNVTRQKIFGTFHYNLSLYIIQPVEVPAVSPSADHVITRVPEQTLVFEHAAPKGQFPYKASEARTFGQYGNKRTRRQAERYSVELFTVVDYKSYQFWYGLAPGSDKHSQALQMIMQYMAYMVNAIDMRYKTIASENFVFDILFAGIYISDSAEAAPWSEDKQVNGKIDSGATLDAFTEWIQEQNNLPQFDHAMGFTGYDVASSTTSGDSSGIAFTSALCTPQSTSIVEDRFSFLAMTTAAHELGHSLGAVHDGAGNTCNGSDNYIMASVNSIRSDPVLGQHLWQFSTCSVQAFKSYINQLDRLNTNCMLSTSDVSQRATTPKPMAEMYGPDETCVKTFGQGSYVCRSVQNYDTICTGMFCNSPGTTQCYSILPAEGTPCGKGKWCEKGKCITSPGAPQNVADNCPIGDRPGLFDDTGKTCAELVAQNAGNCYSTYTSATCCASCNQVKTNDANCEYGDYNATYCPTMSRFGCYRNEQFCCKTCKERKNLAFPGCEFGDKFTGCLKSNCPLYDATNLAGCCETCADPAKTVQTSTTTTPKPTTTTTTTTSTTSTTPSTTKSTTSTTTTSTTTATTATTTKPSTSTPSTTKSTASTIASTKSTTAVTSNASLTSSPPTTTIKITNLPVTTSKPKTTSGPGTDGSSTDNPKQEKVSELLVVAVGCGVGAVVVVVIVIIICVVIRRRKAQLTAARGRKPSRDNTYDNIGFVSAVSDKPNHPPPRRDGSLSQSNSLPNHPSTSANNVVLNGSTVNVVRY